jgi:choline dehydrogenase-like flavoprotein
VIIDMQSNHNLDFHSNLRYDVVIIGSGAGGSIAAAYLSAKGYNVAVIEEGPNVKKTDFIQNERRAVKDYYRLGGALSTDDMAIKILQGRVLGGSTTINWMNCFRTPDHVLEEWETDFDLDEFLPNKMENHFTKVEKRLSVHTIPKDEQSIQNLIILKGAKNLNIHADSCSNNSINCIGCGKCGLGCYYDAKQDMRLTYLNDAVVNGSTIYTSLKCEEIQYKNKNEQTVITSIINGAKSGENIKFHASKVIIAAGAIYSPLLVQKSGLNKNGISGKYLHIHPVIGTAGLYEKNIYPTYGIPMTAYSYEYKDITNGYGFWQEVPDLEVFLAGVNTPGFGSDRREFLRKINNLGAIITLTRDGASKKSNGTVSWRNGYNHKNGRFTIKKVPSIRYSVDKLDKKHMLFGLKNAIELHLAAGAKEVVPFHYKMMKIKSINDLEKFMKLPMGSNQLSIFSAHPTGTNRMGKNSKQSVVDETLQMHHYPGVYVMDGSILPTAPGVNPMITILATVSRALELGNF